MAAGPVLLVEDDHALADVETRNLTARGYTTRQVDTVAGALAAIQEVTPALIVLDIDLPDGSGWEVLRALRASGHAQVPVIALSGLRPNPRLVTELGCVGVLEKPFPIDCYFPSTRKYSSIPASSGAALPGESDAPSTGDLRPDVATTGTAARQQKLQLGFRRSVACIVTFGLAFTHRPPRWNRRAMGAVNVLA